MIRIGIVGCGRILNAHLQGFVQLRERGVDDFRITALVARKEEDARRFHIRGQGPGPRPPLLPPETGDPLAAPHTYLSDFQPDTQVHLYTDHRRMIEERVVDAVLDTTPVFLHHQVGLAALDAHLHLLVQKPLAISVRTARALVEKAHEHRLTLGTFENARYKIAHRAIRWAFDSGLLGERQLAILGAVGGLWSPDRIVADTPWRHHKLLAGGGGSIDIGVHQMSILRHVMGEVVSVQALARTFEKERFLRNCEGGIIEQVQANVDDTHLASVTFSNGAVAQLLWSWACRGAPLALPGVPAFYGSQGCVQGGELILAQSAAPLDLVAHYQQEMSADERERFFPLGLQDPYAILQLDWLQSIQERRDPETSGEEGLRDLAAAYAILESSHLGRTVTLEEMLGGQVDGYQREIDEHYGMGSPSQETVKNKFGV